MLTCDFCHVHRECSRHAREMHALFEERKVDDEDDDGGDDNYCQFVECPNIQWKSMLLAHTRAVMFPRPRLMEK